MNKDMMLKVADAIEQNPTHFHMGRWQWLPPRRVQDNHDSRYVDGQEIGWADYAVGLEEIVGHCGTTACIAGFTVAIAKSEHLIKRDPDRWNGGSMADVAADLLGITPDESKALFYTNTWPDGTYSPEDYADGIRKLANGEWRFVKHSWGMEIKPVTVES